MLALQTSEPRLFGHPSLQIGRQSRPFCRKREQKAAKPMCQACAARQVGGTISFKTVQQGRRLHIFRRAMGKNLSFLVARCRGMRSQCIKVQIFMQLRALASDSRHAALACQHTLSLQICKNLLAFFTVSMQQSKRVRGGAAGA